MNPSKSGATNSEYGGNSSTIPVNSTLYNSTAQNMSLNQSYQPNVQKVDILIVDNNNAPKEDANTWKSSDPLKTFTFNPI